MRARGKYYKILSMSLVENLINQISTQGLGGITSPQGFNLEDDTFSKLLEKQMNTISEPNSGMNLGTMGAPAGLFIEPIEGVEFSETVQDQMEITGDNQADNKNQEPFVMKEIDMSDFFSNLLKANTDNNSDFMNFAKKQATNFYNQHSKNLIMDTREFIQGVLTT